MSVGNVRRGAYLNVLSARRRLSSQAALVYLQIHSRNEPNIRGNTVASGESHDISGDELVREYMQWLAVTAKVRICSVR